MKVTVVFMQLNGDFDPKEFDELGAETEENFRYEWEDEIAITEDVSELKVANNTTYPLRGSYPDGSEFNFDIEHMTVLNASTESGIVQFGASRKLIKRTDKSLDPDSGDVTFTFYLKGKKLFHNPLPGVFIEPGDFPFELD